jgi:hypothetical protein
VRGVSYLYPKDEHAVSIAYRVEGEGLLSPVLRHVCGCEGCDLVCRDFGMV